MRGRGTARRLAISVVCIGRVERADSSISPHRGASPGPAVGGGSGGRRRWCGGAGRVGGPQFRGSA